MKLSHYICTLLGTLSVNPVLTMDNQHKCEICPKTFKKRAYLLKHNREVHTNPERYKCDDCGRSFTRKHDLTVHQRNNCSGQKRRNSSPTRQVRKLRRYECICSICDQRFTGFQGLRTHLMTSHGMQPLELLLTYLPPEVTDNEQLMRCIRESINLIMRPNVNTNLHNQINFFNFEHLRLEDLDMQIREVTKNLANAVKLNFSIGFVMQNIETGEYRFYYAEKNNYVLNDMFQISTPGDIIALLNMIREIDIIETICQDRPNTKYKLVYITNVLYDIHPLDYKFGNDNIVLPDYVMNKRCITSLVRTIHGNDITSDKLCAFRAISCHQLPNNRNIETRTKENFALWIQTHKVTLETFDRISLKDLPLLEELFQINICAYNLHEDDTAQVLYSSVCFYEDTMHVNIYNNHISYINNFATYAKKFECGQCRKIFNRMDLFKKHHTVCQNTRMMYPGGYYTAKQSIYDMLEEYGISVLESQRCYNFYCVFDFESLLRKSDVRAGKSTRILSEHLPISVALSNSINNEVICYVNDSPAQLVQSMLTYCSTVQVEANRLMTYRFSTILAILQHYITFLVSFVCRHYLHNYSVLTITLFKYIVCFFHQYMYNIYINGIL